MCVYVDTRASVRAWKSEDICVESVFFCLYIKFQGLNSVARTGGQDFYPESHLACPRSIFWKYQLLVEATDTEVRAVEGQLCLQVQARVT